jgi:Response regulator with putative antiterminator output domain
LESVLIVSYPEKSGEFFIEALGSVSCEKVVTVRTCDEARRLLMEQYFDLCIINAPLSDGALPQNNASGENLAKHIASKCVSQVILIVKSEFYDEISAAVEDYGVITISKPISKPVFVSALKFAKAAGNKLRLMHIRNNQLTQKIADIRIVDRAKCVLISNLNMSEGGAHRYIEKEAMDKRRTKREIAEEILKTYES